MESNFEEEDGGGTAKRMKLSVDDHSPVMEDLAQPAQHVGPGLLDLSDDVMLIILAFLSPSDLINLSQSCARLWDVTRDRTLWSHVDCRESLLNANQFESDYLDYLLPTTRYLAVDFRLRSGKGVGRSKVFGETHTQGALTPGLLRTIAGVCVGLDTLILQDVCFDAQQIPFGQFPPTLTHLSLKNSDVQNLPVRVSYFNDIHRIMPNIQVLILSHSLWLESHSLMAISKCAKLRELRLQGCYGLGDCIAYFSIATRFGFKDLETLDLRGTQVGDPEVSCLNLVHSLRHLYLESISQYARRRDAEYYMNRVRQYPDITVVPHPDHGPTQQNPVILLQRVDGQMVARNVTGELHGLGHSLGVPDNLGDSPGDAPDGPGTSANPARRPRDHRHLPTARPMIVVPVKRPRASDDPDTLRVRGVITLIHDNVFSAAGRAGTSGVREGEAGPSGEGREVKVQEGRVVVRLNNNINNNSTAAGPSEPPVDPLGDYRECLARYIRDDGVRGGEDGEDNNGPCCSYVRRSPPRKRPCARRGLRPPRGDDSDSDDPSEGEGEGEQSPPSVGSPLHFCTIGRARFSGLTVPFFHRVPQVTDACIHAVGGAGGRPPRLGYNIATLRAEPREPMHESRLQTLVLRHYPKITDQSLYVLSKLASLRYLDVTGTSVTASGVKNFRLMRPDVEVSSDHDVLVEP